MSERPKTLRRRRLARQQILHRRPLKVAEQRGEAGLAPGDVHVVAEAVGALQALHHIARDRAGPVDHNHIQA